MPAAHPEASLEDLNLVARALAMDTLSIEALCRRMQCIPRILRAHNRRLGSPMNEHEVEDAAQDSLMIIWRKLPTFHGESPLEAWVYRICIFEFMNCLRKNSRRRRTEARPLEDLGTEVAAPAAETPWKFEPLQRALDRLPPEEAAVVRAKHFDSITLDQIAQQTGTPSSTIKSRYYRALSRLERELDSETI